MEIISKLGTLTAKEEKADLPALDADQPFEKTKAQAMKAFKISRKNAPTLLHKTDGGWQKTPTTDTAEATEADTAEAS